MYLPAQSVHVTLAGWLVSEPMDIVYVHPGSRLVSNDASMLQPRQMLHSTWTCEMMNQKLQATESKKDAA